MDPEGVGVGGAGWQVLAGDVQSAVRTHRAFFSVWQHYGFTPEGFNLVNNDVQEKQVGHKTAHRYHGHV